MSNNILDAFITQTYGSLDKARIADQLADKNPNAKYEHDEHFLDTGNPNLEKEANEECQKEIMKGHFGEKTIKESMSIPTKIQDGTINDKTKPHPNMNYDHSLEMSRSSKLGLIRIRDLPTGDSEVLYNNMFDDNSNLVEG